MAKENKNAGKVPNLRFPGFEGEWEKKKLGDIGDVKMCKRIFSEETTLIGDIPFFKIGSFGKEADAFISKELYLDYRKRFSFPKKGDILISASGTVGRTVVFRGEDAYFQDSNIVWIDNDNKNVSNDFLFFILQIVKYNTEGGTIQRLYNSILKSTKFSSPAISEQNKISDFLILIYKRIATQNKIIEGLKQLKSLVSKKIFSQQLRFKDEHGNEFPEWEAKKLKEVGKFYVGGDLDKLDYQKEKSLKYRYPIYANGAGLGLYGYASTSQYPKHSVTVSGRGNLGVANVRHEEFNAIVRLIVIVPKSEINPKYLEEIINHTNFAIESTGVPQLTVPQISMYSINIPCLKEQVKIAAFLNIFDRQILIKSNLLKKLKRQKQYLLQNLFI